MFFGIGYMLGPALGALLYEAGGFVLPFVAVGGVGLVAATALLAFIPNAGVLQAPVLYIVIQNCKNIVKL